MSRVAIIGGSGAGELVHESAEIIDTVTTRWGDASGPLLKWQEAGHELLYLGRHGPDSKIPPHRVNYRANIQLLADQNPDYVLATNAVGAIAAHLRPGMLVIPQQLIDYTWGRAHTFFDGDDAGVQFVDFTEPYDPEFRAQIIAAAAEVPHEAGGVYGVTQGPRLETPAEIDRMERDGCTVVGMTSMPEAALARELGLTYAAVCSVVNTAAGRTDGDIHAEIFANLERGMQLAKTVIGVLLGRL
jgi:5'-methylthioinosine phosphorylase